MNLIFYYFQHSIILDLFVIGQLILAIFIYPSFESCYKIFQDQFEIAFADDNHLFRDLIQRDVFCLFHLRLLE